MQHESIKQGFLPNTRSHVKHNPRWFHWSRMIICFLVGETKYSAAVISWLFQTDWTSNPVLISVETTDYPVEDIPFPAITICR